jgi:aldose 1-epimerase
MNDTLNVKIIFIFTGFPGDLLVETSYTLLGDNQLCITMEAKALNKATPVCLVNHAFWNLGGHNSGDC